MLPKIMATHDNWPLKSSKLAVSAKITASKKQTQFPSRMLDNYVNFLHQYWSITRIL